LISLFFIDAAREGMKKKNSKQLFERSKKEKLFGPVSALEIACKISLFSFKTEKAINGWARRSFFFFVKQRKKKFLKKKKN